VIIETIPIEKIKIAKYNPRKDLKPGDPEYEKLKKSIVAFDLVEPLVWNKRSENLIGGHQRLKILKEMGHTEVEVSVVDLPDRKEKALNLALNKISGEWDFPMLKDLLEELDTGEFDIEITGFDDKEIEDLMTQFYIPEEGLTGDDEIPEKVETVCKTGDLWQLGNHRLLCGDATKKEDVERLMNGEKADMVFTDPPYGINLDTDYSKMHRGKGVYTIKRFQQVIGDNAAFDASSLIDVFEYCKEQFWWGADFYRNTIPIGGSWIVWDKRSNEMGIDLDKVLGGQFELCWSRQNHRREIARITWSGHHGLAQDGISKREHPTQKPVQLALWFFDR